MKFCKGFEMEICDEIKFFKEGWKDGYKVYKKDIRN